MFENGLMLPLNSYEKANRYLYKPGKIICLFLIIFNVSTLWAASIEEGKSAYQTRDFKLAFEIFSSFAKQGDSDAQQMLGIMYEQGQGVEKNETEAFKWYLKAAEQGVPTAQHDVGVKYFQGQGVEQDYSRAAYWWEQSANAGLADSQFNLGLLNYRGLGKEVDYQKAAKLFLQAAMQEHASAQYSLAVMHAFGQGVEKNEAEAFNWFKKSASQGVAQAQFNLGVFYENGKTVDQNIEVAKTWYHKAADQGLIEAKQRLKYLEGEQQSEELTPGAKVAGSENIIHPAEATEEDTTYDATGIKREDWVLKQNPGAYTLQLSSVLHEKDIVKFIRDNKLGSEAAYVRVVVNGVTRYSAIYGVYNTYDQARNSIKELPGDLNKAKPWVRNFGIIQGLLVKPSG